jgi:hypothetical protein
MPLPADLKSSYDAVLNDLKAERDENVRLISTYQARLKELNASISTLSKRANADNASPSSLVPSRPANQKYASMSVRWAILDRLADSEKNTTAEIAEALLAGGIQTRAANFANNVSAVLTTTMKEEHKEVEQQPDGKWRLTDKGKEAIEYIRTTGRFQLALRGGNRGFAKA